MESEGVIHRLHRKLRQRWLQRGRTESVQSGSLRGYSVYVLRQVHSGDCNSSSCHIDSCAKWNGDGVSILVQTKILAEFHVDRNVGSRASGEECCQSAVFQAAKHKWVWVLRRQINVISGFIISATKSMVPTSTQIRRPYPRRTSSPCSEIVVKIRPMIPMVHS